MCTCAPLGEPPNGDGAAPPPPPLVPLPLRPRPRDDDAPPGGRAPPSIGVALTETETC